MLQGRTIIQQPRIRIGLDQQKQRIFEKYNNLNKQFTPSVQLRRPRLYRSNRHSSSLTSQFKHRQLIISHTIGRRTPKASLSQQKLMLGVQSEGGLAGFRLQVRVRILRQAPVRWRAPMPVRFQAIAPKQDCQREPLSKEWESRKDMKESKKEEE